jgi:hypothetical protein
MCFHCCQSRALGIWIGRNPDPRAPEAWLARPLEEVAPAYAANTEMRQR